MVRSMAMRAEGPTLHLDLDEIGGGKVVWPFSMGGTTVRRGAMLTAEQIKSINPANRTSLIGRFIRVWPKMPDSAGINASSATGDRADRAERHVVSLGFDHFNVIEGTLLNDEPVSREEAYALAGKPEPSKKRRGKKEH